MNPYRVKTLAHNTRSTNDGGRVSAVSRMIVLECASSRHAGGHCSSMRRLSAIGPEMNRQSDRQVLSLEELSECDFWAIMHSLPPPESAMFDHEVPATAAFELGEDSDPPPMSESPTTRAAKSGR